LSEKKKSPAWIRLAGGGFELAASVVGFTLLGYWLDRHFGWRPWGVLVGALLGIVGGLYNLVKSALLVGREASAEDRSERSQGSGTDT
jgi:F0F1-type ATP synthase assembly protein I